ncbi:GNAT family N-acetyltransferase [Nostoc sp. FACHB-87]|uniref:GNAT family N-acetyltransferase n=1 Tax=Nostocales TaxID=1161 RepID=UPI001685A276|nr:MULTISPECIES: GNAT family N-acetyltransferase [Nostocales]MBD2299573.1 GNAT family N-acetyltransferase [Nostoc sp. FACHB-190]MBD2455317.1 GNAT family N-acetyltransferase [Nostoc sp. FACHB-87]MBD2476858.1 GNAT family N-acetyltransferase [Anabaena sp. FACHB-83]MBD2489235.1 GNAT family N-acetyltransferase [Aulosira sp. FACHB-615]
MTSWFFDSSHEQPLTSAAEQAGQQFQIRAATATDLTAISQIIAESFHSQTGFWGWAFPLLRLGIYEDFRNRLSSAAPHHTCLVAVHTTVSGANNLVGTVELGVRFPDSWKKNGKSFLYLSNLAVDQKYRRHGVASKLLLSCEKLCEEWGFQDLYLHVLEDNHQARQLYFKLGYKICKVESNWNFFFFQQSRQILLHKRLLPNSEC